MAAAHIYSTFKGRKAEKKILCHIALNGSTTAYNLLKELKLAISVAYGTVKNLKDNGLLTVTVLEEKNRVGVNMKEYGLTLEGVSAAFGIEEVRKDMRTFAENWKGLLPLVLGKWDHFIQQGVEDQAIQGFDVTNIILGSLPIDPYIKKFLEDYDHYYSQELTEGDFTYRFFNLGGLLAAPVEAVLEADKKWINAIKLDPEICHFVIKQTIRLENHLRAQAVHFKVYREAFESRAPLDPRLSVPSASST